MRDSDLISKYLTRINRSDNIETKVNSSLLDNINKIIGDDENFKKELQVTRDSDDDDDNKKSEYKKTLNKRIHNMSFNKILYVLASDILKSLNFCFPMQYIFTLYCIEFIILSRIKKIVPSVSLVCNNITT